MKTEVKLITPEIAKMLLAKSNLNRPITKKRVDFYADQMLRNLWRTTGQGISLAKNGAPIDGHHRLRAIVQSGKSIEFLIISDLEFNEVFDKYDTGHKRSGSDTLFIAGYANVSNVSALINYYRTLSQGAQIGKTRESFFCSTSKFVMSNHDTLTFYEDNIELINLIVKLSDELYKKVRFFNKSVMGGIMLFLVKDKMFDVEKVMSFFKQLYTGKNIENTSIEALRNRYIKELGAGTQMTSRYRIALFILAWNAFVSGKEYTQLRFNIEKDNFPQFI